MGGKAGIFDGVVLASLLCTACLLFISKIQQHKLIVSFGFYIAVYSKADEWNEVLLFNCQRISVSNDVNPTAADLG